MKYKNMSLKDAYILVKSKRKVVRPNLGFWGQLVDFEKEVFGKNSVQMIEESFGVYCQQSYSNFLLLLGLSAYLMDSLLPMINTL